ncbi:MAG: ABC transporter ATP-binding protein [Clostridiales bacterium]|nr:MAG: ABC transporter ATP-binding protein [Clostridiales bacterium]
MENILECKNLSKMYKNNLALSNINLAVGKGRIVGLLGPNGSGKTTFIKLANGLLTPTSGEILINGLEIGVETKKIVSYLPDHNFLSPWMSVEQMINYFVDFYSDFQSERAYTMLQNLGINPKAKIKTLSKGTQEKVALILVMSRDAQLYLLDEPIAGVDPATRDYILRTILTNYNEEATIIISTHLIADVEQILSDVIFINMGRVVLCDTVDNIRQREQKSVDELFREEFRC